MEQFMEWLNMQPETRSFDYTDNNSCMIGTFLQEWFGIEFQEISVGSNNYTVSFYSPHYKIPVEIVLALRKSMIIHKPSWKVTVSVEDVIINLK